MLIQGKNSSLTINEGTITVSRHVRPFSPPLRKDIPINKITAVTFQPASFLYPGYIIFSLVGGTEPRSGSINAALNDNSVLFTKKQEPSFLQAKEHVDRLISAV
jgi:hypothetical protein